VERLRRTPSKAVSGREPTVGTGSRPSAEERAAEERDRRLQLQARALGDPTRYRIFRYVTNADGPVGVPAITAHVGVNHNSVRQHLAKLCAAGLLVEDVVRSGGRGRPALRYRPERDTSAFSGTTSPYEHLAVLLLEVMQGRSPGEVGAAAGRRAIGPAVAGGDPLDVLEDEMHRQGFPSHREETDKTVDLVVSHCPFAVAATLNSDVVCELHRGLAQGMVAALGAEVLHIGLVRRDPHMGGCRIQLELTAGEPRPNATGSAPA